VVARATGVQRTDLVDAFEDGTVVVKVAHLDDALDVPLGAPSEGGEGLDLAGEEEAAVAEGVVEGLDTEAVAGGEEQVSARVVEDERELAAEPRD
jgi:hypothetical protein